MRFTSASVHWCNRWVTSATWNERDKRNYGSYSARLELHLCLNSVAHISTGQWQLTFFFRGTGIECSVPAELVNATSTQVRSPWRPGFCAEKRDKKMNDHFTPPIPLLHPPYWSRPSEHADGHLALFIAWINDSDVVVMLPRQLYLQRASFLVYTCIISARCMLAFCRHHVAYTMFAHCM